jgi:hypothetical protein
MRSKGHLLVRCLHSAVFLSLPFLILTLSSGLLTLPAYSADVTLAWDASTEPAWLIGGYKIYYNKGCSGPPYSSSVTMSVDQDENLDPDIVEYTLTGLDDNEDYFISVTVFTNDDPPIESDYSNEVATNSINSIESDYSNEVATNSINSLQFQEEIYEEGCFIKTIGF